VGIRIRWVALLRRAALSNVPARSLDMRGKGRGEPGTSWMIGYARDVVGSVLAVLPKMKSTVDASGTLLLAVSVLMLALQPVGCGGSGSEGKGSGGAAGTGGSDTGNPVGCPSRAPLGFPTCSLASGVKCAYVHGCNSGEVRLDYACEAGRFRIVPQPCALPYDSCAGTALHCDDGQWVSPPFGPPDNPGQCPSARPVDGDVCTTSSLWSRTWSQCGYACDPGAGVGKGWTVVECVAGDGGLQHWQSDGACL
jgi:hypothetical protein